MVSTQMLHSMHHAAVPTRAEVTDVYQAARAARTICSSPARPPGRVSGRGHDLFCQDSPRTAGPTRRRKEREAMDKVSAALYSEGGRAACPHARALSDASAAAVTAAVRRTLDALRRASFPAKRRRYRRPRRSAPLPPTPSAGGNALAPSGHQRHRRRAPIRISAVPV